MASDERFLVTGALGCIGAWTVRNLVRAGVPTTVLDLAREPNRIKLIMTDEEVARIRFIAGDVTDLDMVERALAQAQATHVIHLAALQVPACQADPPLGARVNVTGTVNMLEAARRAGLDRVVYASSIAVYAPAEAYPQAPVAHDAPLQPHTHYGVYKQANEGNARVYWSAHGLSSIGLRPYVVYGPGRDQGLTSGPTKAMLAAVLGQPYHIGFGGRFNFQFADDVARIFIQAARASFEGADVFNLRGALLSMDDIVAAVEAAEPASRGQITFDPKPLPFPDDMDDAPLTSTIGPVPQTPLADGVARTIEIFRQAIGEGKEIKL